MEAAIKVQDVDKRLFVDEVVAAVTGSGPEPALPQCQLAEQMRRAAGEFDQRTADAFARALLEALCLDPSNLPRLEALMILGLAHPTILERYRISLPVEGRRLALMLERAGQAERARILLATIDEHIALQAGDEAQVLERIERCLRAADERAAAGRTREAIVLLEEALALDPERRDLGRVIRDLRFAERERRWRRRRQLKIAALILAAGAAVSSVLLRERTIAERFGALPLARAGDQVALQARLDGVCDLLERERLWLGMGPATRERAQLQREIALLEQQAAARARELVAASAQRADQAEAARLRGMLLAEQGRFDAALADLRRALDLGGSAWEHRSQVRADLEAIEVWLRQEPR